MVIGRRLTLMLALGAVILSPTGGDLVGGAAGQTPAPAPGRPLAPGAPAPPDVHGTPKGWRFTLPKGDPAKGREVFQKLECYSCHEVRGEHFPSPSDPGRAGPELSMMGPLHPPEFFAESIINPSAVVERSRGYAAADGSSKMPSYGSLLTVQETIDLVAYLRQLRPPAASAPGHGGHSGRTTP
jgi:mono/diheme cytochrome c family protein